ncbi:molybdate ABC transporter substrate-binding protein [Enterococcus sp. AZ109]|uniref:molybdate ABC transporter substrate-binding protein n=1 Tax=Enterococcus sp. AZ109 TaxID=2774634 RepID=UPI003F248402
MGRKNVSKRIGKLIVFIIVGLLLQGCNGQPTDETSSSSATKTAIHYSAAASLKDALTDIQKLYQSSYPDQDVAIDYGGSGAIREKVLAGSPIDGVLLASQSDTDQLVDGGKLTDVEQLLQNKLVIIKNQQSEIEKNDTITQQLEAADSIAIGEPETVPAGKYAVETMENNDVYEQLKPALVMASDVRQVLSYVEAGNADLGFVYETDAKLSDQVTVLQAVPSEYHAPIVYNMGVVSDSKNSEAAKSFNQFLTTKEAKQIFEHYGFTLAK